MDDGRDMGNGVQAAAELQGSGLRKEWFCRAAGRLPYGHFSVLPDRSVEHERCDRRFGRAAAFGNERAWSGPQGRSHHAHQLANVSNPRTMFMV